MRADDILKDDAQQAQFSGVNVRKGTIAAFIANAKVVADPTASEDERREAIKDISDALPALRAVGLFDVMTVKNSGVRALIEERG